MLVVQSAGSLSHWRVMYKEDRAQETEYTSSILLKCLTLKRKTAMRVMNLCLKCRFKLCLFCSLECNGSCVNEDQHLWNYITTLMPCHTSAVGAYSNIAVYLTQVSWQDSNITEDLYISCIFMDLHYLLEILQRLRKERSQTPHLQTTEYTSKDSICSKSHRAVYVGILSFEWNWDGGTAAGYHTKLSCYISSLSFFCSIDQICSNCNSTMGSLLDDM